MEAEQGRETVFIAPQALQRVRNENEQLRTQLRELSGRLDALLASHPKKSLDPATIRSKELTIARSHLDHHSKVLKDLLLAQSQLSPTRIPELQREVTALTEQIKAKEVSNKGLRRLEKERGEELNSLTEDSGAMAELKAAAEYTRRYHKAVSDVEKELLRGDETLKTVAARVVELEGKYKEEVAKAPEAAEDEEPKMLAVVEQDVDKIRAKVAALEKKKHADLTAYRRELTASEQQLATLQKQLLDAQSCFKDKERQSRVANLSVKEALFVLKTVQKKNESLQTALKTTPHTNEEGEQSSAFITAPASE